MVHLDEQAGLSVEAQQGYGGVVVAEGVEVTQSLQGDIKFGPARLAVRCGTGEDEARRVAAEVGGGYVRLYTLSDE